ncbi:hypothetical protein S101258_00039 [Lactiplantibacillus plantarum subsp. plantarum]|uniref:ABC-2 type transporter transmembrane domain-containing protein n=1 Tax=Lactiplantibacillus plantarum subsp. plantarum TaxID=337330 RepID=A0A2S3UAR7_LACPN|nr:hypothetical protein S101258_00039 [Lactiplantibacillus plantarum subsp. plantarum]
MRTMAIVRRVFKQMLRDKRTLALMFLAPLLIMTLMYFLFQNNTTQLASLGVHHVDQSVVNVIDTKNVTIHHYDSSQARKMIKQHDLDGYLTQKNGQLTITYSNSNPTNTSLIKASLQSGLVKLKMKTLVTVTKKQRAALESQQAALKKLTAAQTQATVTRQLLRNYKSNSSKPQPRRLVRLSQLKQPVIRLSLIIFMVVVIQRSLKAFCQPFSVSLSSSLCS